MKPLNAGWVHLIILGLNSTCSIWSEEWRPAAGTNRNCGCRGAMTRLQKAGINITGLGDAGEMPDEQAKSTYRRRLSELREELEEAKEFGNTERAEKAEAEIDAVTSELSRAVGLGGRDRRAGSASDRARQSVAKTIKSVLERIAQERRHAGGYLFEMHQDRDLLLLPA